VDASTNGSDQSCMMCDPPPAGPTLIGGISSNQRWTLQPKGPAPQENSGIATKSKAMTRILSEPECPNVFPINLGAKNCVYVLFSQASRGGRRPTRYKIFKSALTRSPTSFNAASFQSPCWFHCLLRHSVLESCSQKHPPHRL
jgi:hypothetical protein